MKKLLVSAIALAASAVVPALAADLPTKGPVVPMVPPPPAYNWTGCYIGANIGGAWGGWKVTDNYSLGLDESNNNSGFAGGGQIGCDYQFAGGWVIGFRNLFDGTTASHTRNFDVYGYNVSLETKTQWFDQLTGRIGFLVTPQVLLYGQGGAAWANVEGTLSALNVEIARSKNSRTGWTAGGGAEWLFAPHWSVFLEYNYLGFQRDSNVTCIASICPSNAFSIKSNIQNVLLGVNYRF
jgi:outer membrane immunogenic protein